MSSPSEDRFKALMQSAFSSEAEDGFERLDPEARATLSAIISTGLAATGRPARPFDQNEISIMARFHLDDADADPSTPPIEGLDFSDESLAELESVGAFLAAVEGQDEGPPAALMAAAQAMWQPAPAPKKTFASASWARWLFSLSPAPALAAASIVAVVVAVPVGMTVFSQKPSPAQSGDKPVVLAKVQAPKGINPPVNAVASPRSPSDGTASLSGSPNDPLVIAGATAASGAQTASARNPMGGEPGLESAAAGAAGEGRLQEPSSPSDGWSSVAVSGSGGAVGVSDRQGSQLEADAAAMADCAKTGATDCTLRRPSSGRCTALASAPGGRVDVASASTPASAQAAAAKLCRDHAGATCRVTWNACRPQEP